jgi:hypothetical protein
VPYGRFGLFRFLSPFFVKLEASKQANSIAITGTLIKMRFARSLSSSLIKNRKNESKVKVIPDEKTSDAEQKEEAFRLFLRFDRGTGRARAEVDVFICVYL